MLRDYTVNMFINLSNKIEAKKSIYISGNFNKNDRGVVDFAYTKTFMSSVSEGRQKELVQGSRLLLELFLKQPGNENSTWRMSDNELGWTTLSPTLADSNQIASPEAVCSSLAVAAIAPSGYFELAILDEYSNENFLKFGFMFKSIGLEILARGLSIEDNFTTRVLSKSELECLKWTANGKTSTEIGQILNLSHHTINHYLTNALGKMGVVNRAHAVSQALKKGLIKPYEIY